MARRSRPTPLSMPTGQPAVLPRRWRRSSPRPDAVDAAEDVLLGDRRGDELPPELADATSRKARLAACREKLAAKAAETAARQQEKIDTRAAEEQATGKGKRGRKLKPADDSVGPGRGGQRHRSGQQWHT